MQATGRIYAQPSKNFFDSQYSDNHDGRRKTRHRRNDYPLRIARRLLNQTVTFTKRRDCPSDRIEVKKLEKSNEWSDAELAELEKLCAPLVKYLQTNHKRCNIYSAIIVMYDSVLFAGGDGGNVYFPFKVPD